MSNWLIALMIKPFIALILFGLAIFIKNEFNRIFGDIYLKRLMKIK